MLNKSKYHVCFSRTGSQTHKVASAKSEAVKKRTRRSITRDETSRSLVMNSLLFKKNEKAHVFAYINFTCHAPYINKIQELKGVNRKLK